MKLSEFFNINLFLILINNIILIYVITDEQTPLKIKVLLYVSIIIFTIHIIFNLIEKRNYEEVSYDSA